jgi:hypothetical protein
MPEKCKEEKKTFEERELDILRESVDKIEESAKKKVAQSPIITKIIEVLENFLRKKQLMCYGGTALNNILPKKDQFYDKNTEIPDYDFYSPNALDDAKELADIYSSLGYDDVEARAGMHHGTFKVQVHFIPIADITHMEKKLFLSVKKEAIKINGILYAPSNLLRLNVYTELSRPEGDVARWEKIFKRLTLLNKHYPIKKQRCEAVKFMRDFEGNQELASTLYGLVKKAIIDQGLVFFGGYACEFYSKYLPVKHDQIKQGQIKHEKNKSSSPDFDALSETPEESAKYIKDKLTSAGVKNVKIYKKPGADEIIAPHYEIAVGNQSVCFIYQPLGCHSYNTLRVNNDTVKIASIDTMLNLYLAFMYADRPYYEKDRILCMAQYLFTVQSKNRLINKGLLKRFNSECYGTQQTLQTIRETRAEKFVELKPKRGTKEYDEYFLKYTPGEKPIKNKTTKTNKTIKLAKTIKKVSTKMNRTKMNKTIKNKAKMNKTEKRWFKLF